MRAFAAAASSPRPKVCWSFGPPGGGKTHLAIALGRAAVETGHSVLCPGATALLAALAKTEPDGQLCSIRCGQF